MYILSREAYKNGSIKLNRSTVISPICVHTWSDLIYLMEKKIVISDLILLFIIKNTIDYYITCIYNQSANTN